jgi:hypothetical protein
MFEDIIIEKFLARVWDNTGFWRWTALVVISELIAILAGRDLLSQWIFQSRYYAHDLNKFKESNQIMDEQVFMSYISTLYHSNSMYLSVGVKIDDWCAFISRKENEYLTRKIRLKVDAFYRILTDIGSFTAKHFFTPTRGNIDRVSLYPDPKTTSEERQRYENYEKELQRLIQKALAIYADYRGEVKKSLQV